MAGVRDDLTAEIEKLGAAAEAQHERLTKVGFVYSAGILRGALTALTTLRDALKDPNVPEEDL